MNINPKELSVRKLQAVDLSKAAEVHRESFPKSVLTLLGLETIRRYYEWQLLGPHQAYALGIFHHEQLAGFCFGGVYRGAMSGFLRKNKTFLIFKIIFHPWLLFQPLFRDRIKFGLRALKLKTKKTITHARQTSFGILSIAVRPHFQKCGIGRILMDEARSVAEREGFRKMHLTVEGHNLQAVHFYEGLGWKKIYQDSGWTGRMEKEL